MGIGFGYLLGTTPLDTPNITSVRFRLASGLTFEPVVILEGFKHTTDTGTAVDDKRNTLSLGALLRYPLIRHGRVDFEFLGAFNIDNVKTDPNGMDDITTTTTTALSYGFSVNTWVNRHLEISMSATNPVLSFQKVKQEMGPMNVLVTSDTTFGIEFRPTVSLMGHLYY